MDFSDVVNRMDLPSIEHVVLAILSKTPVIQEILLMSKILQPILNGTVNPIVHLIDTMIDDALPLNRFPISPLMPHRRVAPPPS